MSNTFGKIFKITTFGESHGKKIGVVIDGCPSNLKITEEEINAELEKRKPSVMPFTSKRKEKDIAKIVSGTYKNKTTGAPILIEIENKNFSSKNYEKIKDLYRPGHFTFTYLKKYNIIDPYGASRASARETASKVAAGAIAKKILFQQKIEVLAFLKQVGPFEVKSLETMNFLKLQKNVNNSSIFCPDKKIEKKILKFLTKIKQEKDSIGAKLQLISTSLPIGLGDPIYEKLSSNLAKAIFTIPSVSAFEIGSGVKTPLLKGSENNDEIVLKNKKIFFKTNRAGGVLAGISNGMPLDLKVCFKPTPTFLKPQKTVNFKNQKKVLNYPKDFQYDICTAIRAKPVVEAMVAIVLVDSFLMQNAYILN